MGSTSSSFLCTPKQAEILPNSLKPTNPAWLVKHVEACDMPVLKVQRCWKRYQQLGVNKQGALTTQSKIWKTEDRFVQQITRQFPWSDQGTLPFVVYLNMCKWFEDASLEVKSKALFSLLNRGEVVDSGIIQRILRHVYPKETAENISQMSNIFIEQIDAKKKNYVDEDDFVSWMQKLPVETFSEILDFNILPIPI